MLTLIASSVAMAPGSYWRIYESAETLVYVSEPVWYAKRQSPSESAPPLVNVDVITITKQPVDGVKATIRRADIDCREQKYRVVSVTYIAPDMRESTPRVSSVPAWKADLPSDPLGFKAWAAACARNNFSPSFDGDIFADAARRFSGPRN